MWRRTGGGRRCWWWCCPWPPSSCAEYGLYYLALARCGGFPQAPAAPSTPAAGQDGAGDDLYLLVIADTPHSSGSPPPLLSKPTTKSLLFAIFLSFLWLREMEMKSTRVEATHTCVLISSSSLDNSPTGHWFDRARREWQMERAFQSVLSVLEPDAALLLGDATDEGKARTAPSPTSVLPSSSPTPS